MQADVILADIFARFILADNLKEKTVQELRDKFAWSQMQVKSGARVQPFYHSNAETEEVPPFFPVEDNKSGMMNGFWD